MSALTQKASGRIFALLLALAVVGVSLIIALRPAGAVNGVAYEDVDAAEVCASFLGDEYEGETAIISVPRGGSNDRVFELTGLALGDRGVTVDLSLVNNRKDLSFWITAGTVEGVALVDGNQGDSGLFFGYESVDEGQATYTANGNVKSIVLCYTPFYEGVLACGDTASDTGVLGEIATSAEVIRLDGLKNDCSSLLPYTLEITLDNVQFLYPDEDYVGEKFLLEIDWAPAEGDPDQIVIGKVRQVALDDGGDGFDDGDYDDMVACDVVLTTVVPGEIPDISDPATYPTYSHPGGTPICLLAQVLNGVQTQVISGEFDPAWK
ncbi:MAG: hypothetical protein R6W79_02420 [Acidimicrobiia bacterium]